MIHKNTLLALVAIGGFLAALLITLAPSCKADSGQDADFLYLVTHNGLSFDNANLAIAQGKAVCSMLNDGHSPESVVQTVYLALDGIHTIDAAQTIVAASIVVYCPQFKPAHHAVT